MGRNRCAVRCRLFLCLWIPLVQANCPYQDNSIWSIPDGSLPANLTDIDLEANPISAIDDNAFEGSETTLASLYLSGVRFAKFPDAFASLRALSELSIKSANITDWNEYVWKNLGKTLETLDLENVGITTWPTWIQYFLKLTDLTIASGSISTIPDHALDSLTDSLQSLSIYNNRFTVVPKAISNLNSLKELYIHENFITDVSWLPYKSQLGSLALSHNFVSNASQLSQSLHHFNGSLNSLDIDNNHLTDIPDLSFLPQITSLDFSHNRISNSSSGAVSSETFLFDMSYNYLSGVPTIMSTLLYVTDFTLSHNIIKNIQESDFHSQLMSADLSYNLITQITDTSFPEDFGLLYLQLNNNPLMFLSPVALQRLAKLYELNLRNTEITRLPLALNYLSGLVQLDVSNISGLVCTCMESSLRSWVVALRPQNVNGFCGVTSVYYFYITLSQYCPTSEQ